MKSSWNVYQVFLLGVSLVLSACGGGGGGSNPSPAPTTYTIGGTVTSLSGSGLVLQNNSGDNLAISSNGSFTFSTALTDLSSYSVTVLTQPNTPNQICTVSNGSGTLSGANITNVAVNCVTNTYTVGGTVTGLNGTGLVLQNNAGDNLSVGANGSFTFATVLADLSSYAVTVLTQPNTPNQICTVSNGSGSLSGANVTNVAINCINTYTIGGNVSGLNGNGLVLRNNGGDDLSISGNGSFTFATALTDLSSYSVTVQTQPTNLSQTCTVTNGSGSLSGANVTNVAISCTTDSFTIGGSVNGLSGTGLELQNNGGDDLAVGGTAYTFGTALVDGSNYEVTVKTQPTGQMCDVSNRAGTLAGANITNATVTCRSWGPAGLIETDNTGNASTPRIASDANGNALAVWHQHDGTRNNIWANHYTAGGTWGTPVLVETDDLGNATNPDVAIDTNGNGMAVWRQYDGFVQRIWASRYVSGVWTTPEKIENIANGFARNARVAFDANGNAIAVWGHFNVVDSVWTNRYTAGSGWGTPELLEQDDTGNALEPRIAIDSNGNAMAIWEQSTGAQADIWSNRYSSGSWGTAVLVESNDSGDAESAQIAFDTSGDAIAVWEHRDATNLASIWSNRYTGGSWGSPELLESNGGQAFNPQLAIDASGNALAVWYQHDGIRNNIWSNRYTAGSAWGTAALIENDNSDTTSPNPQISMDANGNALAVWHISDGTRHNIWSNRYTAGSGWGTAEMIETDNAGNAYSPQVTIDGNRNGIAVWYQSDGTQDDIWSNRFQ